MACVGGSDEFRESGCAGLQRHEFGNGVRLPVRNAHIRRDADALIHPREAMIAEPAGYQSHERPIDVSILGMAPF